MSSLTTGLAERRREQWKNRAQALAAVRRLSGVREFDKLPPSEVTRRGVIQRDGYRIEKMVIQGEPGIPLSALLFVPKKAALDAERHLYLHGKGKHVDAVPGGPIEQLVRKGKVVLAVDLRGIGETTTSGRDVTISYLLGKSLVGMRAEDVLQSARMLSEWQNKDQGSAVHLTASGVAEAAAIHAAALESSLFVSIKVNGDTLRGRRWSEIRPRDARATWCMVR